jgi:hypothetical protein
LYTGLFRGVQHAELIQEHREGPEIDHDVVHYQQKEVFLCRSSEQAHPQYWPSFQIKRALSFRDQPGLQLITAPG